MIKFDSYTIASIHQADAESLSAMMIANKDRFYRYFPKTLEQNLSREGSEVFIEHKKKQFDSKEEFLFAILASAKVIGLVYIKELDWTKKQGEFAYCIGKEFSGKGVVTRAVELLSAFAFSDLGLEILQIIAHKDNLPSIMVAKNAGFNWQRTLPNAYAPPNETPLHMELYERYKN